MAATGIISFINGIADGCVIFKSTYDDNPYLITSIALTTFAVVSTAFVICKLHPYRTHISRIRPMDRADYDKQLLYSLRKFI